ncbi:MAG: ABC-F family ATP-binding cassette domain-containing protein [Bacilli bacterium]
MILNVEKLSKNYGIKKLLDNINFTIEEKDKIGIIGNNGTGKTTLLKLLAGLEEPDQGNIIYAPSIKISYLAQNTELDNKLTIFEQMLLSVNNQTDAIMEHDIKTILTKLGLTDFTKAICDLSGGQKRRLSLAQTLIKPADVLILDEPTNHLDGNMILWLEKFLLKFNKILIMVTHDRYFLERITNKMFELEDGQLFVYPANYSQYLTLKIEKEEMLIASKRKLDAFLRKEQQWISRGAKARTTKDRRRISQYEELSGIIYNKKAILNLESTASRLGRKTVELQNVSKSYEKPIINNFSLIIPNDARIGITGQNGCGKTTLLKIIAGFVLPDFGQVNIGETVKIGYFSQENEDLNDQMRIIDFIKGIAEVVKSGKSTLSASQMIEKFLFDNPYSLIGTLSGGEKRRLMLLALLMASPNILLLDEPTNNLDITTMNIFESYLDDFEGAVVVASHDRYFLDKICDRFYEFTENGLLEPHMGKYSDFLVAPKEEEQKTKDEEREKPKNSLLKLTFQEQLEFQKIESIIDELENELMLVNHQISEKIGNYELQKPFLDKKATLEKTINEKIARWEYLSQKDDMAKRGK